MRRVVTAALVLGLLGGVVMAGAWAWQRNLVYFPDATDPGAASRVHPTARDVILRTADGLELGAWFVLGLLQQEGYAADRTIYLGESLGTGVAAALAARQPPAGLVLRSPFTELADVGAHHYPWLPVRLLLRDRFPVLEHVRESDVPTSVVHGTADDVVPSALSAEVAAAVPTLVEEKVLPDVGHNDAEMFGAEIVAVVGHLVDHLDEP